MDHDIGHEQASTTFSNLPAEIICKVYETLAEVYKPQPAPRSLGWIHLTHVSQRFRNIGLDMHALWAEDLCVFPGALDIFLQRARHAPLHYKIDTTAECASWLQESLLKVASQVRALELRFICLSLLEGVETKHFLECLKLAPLSALEVLSFTIRPPNSHLTEEDETDIRVLVRQGKPIYGPVLRQLRIRRLFIPFSAPALQSLEISDCEDFTIEDLCRVLRDVPELRYLRWRGRGVDSWRPADSRDSDYLTRLSPVNLPHLETFDLADKCSALCALAQTIGPPSVWTSVTKSVNPTCIYLGYLPHLEHSNAEKIAQTLAHFKSRLTCRSTTLIIPLSRTGFHHILLSDDWDPADQEMQDIASVILGLKGSNHDDSAMPWISPLAALITGVMASGIVPNLRSLYVTDDLLYKTVPEYDYSARAECTLSDALPLLHNVTTLYLASQADALIDSLRRSTRADDGGGVLLPLLDTLILDYTDRHVGWSRGTSREEHERERHYRAPEDRHFGDSWWKSFCEMLSSRARIGYRLRRLILRGRTCHLTVASIAGSYPVTYLEPIKLAVVEEWVDEVVDEREACGMEDGVENPYHEEWL